MAAHRTRWLVAAAAAALVAAGCSASTAGSASSTGSNSGGGSGDSSCGSSEPGLCTTIEVTGAVSVQGSFHTGMGGGLIDSCVEYVKGESGGRRLMLPTSLGGQPVGGHQIAIANRISKYKGPGSYEKDALGAIDGGVHVDIDRKSYQSSEGYHAQAVINADGSGSFTFTNLKEATNSSDSSPKGLISGSYRWTCSGK